MHVNTRAAAASLAAAALLVGCAGTPALMPTPAIYVGDTTKRLFAGTSAEPAATTIDLLYITDRAAATAAEKDPFCLVAVGGYGRGELTLGSDLDLLLLHKAGAPEAARVAERIWYPIWDSGLRLDHSVRTVSVPSTVAV